MEINNEILLSSIPLKDVLSLFREVVKEELSKSSQSYTRQKEEEDIWFDMKQFRDYHPLHPARITVCKWMKEKGLPYHKNGGLIFLKSEVDKWIRESRIKTQGEIDIEVDQSIKKHFKNK